MSDMAFFLDEQAEQLRREGEGLIRRIEEQEAELVDLRDRRDKAFRRSAEARTAANILREVGLRSSTIKGAPFIELDYTPRRPDATEGAE